MTSIESARNQVEDRWVELMEAKSAHLMALTNFRKEFRKARKEAGLSIRDVAKKLNLSAPYISDVELGRRNPNEKVINFFK